MVSEVPGSRRRHPRVVGIGHPGGREASSVTVRVKVTGDLCQEASAPRTAVVGASTADTEKLAPSPPRAVVVARAALWLRRPCRSGSSRSLRSAGR